MIWKLWLLCFTSRDIIWGLNAKQQYMKIVEFWVSTDWHLAFVINICIPMFLANDFLLSVSVVYTIVESSANVSAHWKQNVKELISSWFKKKKNYYHLSNKDNSSLFS